MWQEPGGVWGKQGDNSNRLMSALLESRVWKAWGLGLVANGYESLRGIGLVSKDEHGVAVAEESIALLDRCGVGAQDAVASSEPAGIGEGADEHEQGGFGQVKVGDEGVDDPEPERGMDEEAGFTGGGEEPVGLLRGDVFEDAHGGGADGHHAAVGGAGGVELIGGARWEFEPFGVHAMPFDGGRLNGRECAEPDMEGEATEFDAAGFEFSEQGRSEVKSGGGCGDGAGRLRVDGLVPFHVGELRSARGAMDVGGERDLTN
jgi:hypothetical protein